MSFATEKAALIDVLKANECTATKDVYDNLNSYADIPDFFFSYAKTFDGDNAYLYQLAAIFDDASLQAVGVYYNKTSITITNPKVVIYCRNVIVNVDAGGNYGDLEIVGASQLNELNIENNTTIDSLAISGGSVVDELTIEDGSIVEALQVKSENGQDSTLTTVVADQDSVKDLAIAPGTTFGGFQCNYLPEL